MTEIVDRLVEWGEAHVRRVLLERGEKDLAPLCVIVTEDRQLALAPMGWGSAEERAVMLAALRALMKEVGAVAYSCLNEGWAIHRPVGQGPGELPPSQCDDRVEIVSVMAFDRTSGRGLSLKMQRDPAGRLIGLTPWGDAAEGANLGGDLAHLLEGTVQ